MSEPSLLKRIWAVLLKVAHRIGRVQAWIIFTLFYFIVMAPAAVVLRLCSDPLHLRRRSSPWVPHGAAPKDRLAWGRLQF